MGEMTSNLGFEVMSMMFRIRDILKPRHDILREVDIGVGSTVLDFGCGPGSYLLPLSGLVGTSGKIFALDVHPRSLQKVNKLALAIPTIETILSDCHTGLPVGSIDVVLLYDVLHELNHPAEVLREIHRVLKPTGTLSVNDPHWEEREIIAKVTAGNIFRFSHKGATTYSFKHACSQA